jgi:hypothetical protein
MLSSDLLGCAQRGVAVPVPCFAKARSHSWRKGGGGRGMRARLARVSGKVRLARSEAGRRRVAEGVGRGGGTRDPCNRWI